MDNWPVEFSTRVLRDARVIFWEEALLHAAPLAPLLRTAL
jgi:hypothetical protein